MKQTITALLVLVSSSMHAQQSAYSDPAQAYNKLMIEKNGISYTRVGAFKVAGSPFLFGEKRPGDVFSTTDSGRNIPLSYNVYSQEIVFSNGRTETLVREPGTVDSFVIRKTADAGMAKDLLFIYGKLLNVKDKAYLQVVEKGKRFTLYKKYSAGLAIVSANYSQPDLRQFEITVDYFYSDNNQPGLKKLKTTADQLVKEFSKIKDLSTILDRDQLTMDKERQLINLFASLNE